MIKLIRSPKRYFQLLEIMIALFLVAVCAIPILGSYVYIYREHKAMHQKIELDHYAHLAHAKMIEELYRKGAEGVPIRELLDKETPISLSELTSGTILPYDFSYKLTVQLPKPGKRREKTKKVLLNLTLYPKERNTSPTAPLHEYNYLAAVKLDFKEGQGNGLVVPSTIKSSKNKEEVKPDSTSKNENKRPRRKGKDEK